MVGPLKKGNWDYSLTDAYNSHSCLPSLAYTHTHTLYPTTANQPRSLESKVCFLAHRHHSLNTVLSHIILLFCLFVYLLHISRLVQWKYEGLKLLYTQDLHFSPPPQHTHTFPISSSLSCFLFLVCWAGSSNPVKLFTSPVPAPFNRIARLGIRDRQG